MDHSVKLALLVTGIFLLVFLVWGFVGGLQADSIGVTCDMGLGDALCWQWHTNVVGQVGEILADAAR